ncbi:MAG: hypothetical protein ACQET5_10075 [Halobacteriota archaeon]|uniref:hypothetical protein n=1 Tax=Natronomonas sp. TaxID=2184060 RepID=UPI0039764FDD
MNRRNIVIGLGGLIGSAGVTLGTGAFSASELERESNISVVDDSAGLIGLVPNESIAGVMTAESGLTIAIDEEHGGVNVNSVYQFGAFVEADGVADLTDGTFTLVTDDDPADMSDGQASLESAFAILNQSGETRDVTVDFELNDDIESGSETEYAFELQSSIGGSGQRVSVATSPIDNDVEFEMEPGDSIGISFIVNAFDGSIGDAIDGQVEISAN